MLDDGEVAWEALQQRHGPVLLPHGLALTCLHGAGRDWTATGGLCHGGRQPAPRPRWISYSLNP